MSPNEMPMSNVGTSRGGGGGATRTERHTHAARMYGRTRNKALASASHLQTPEVTS